MAAPLLKRWAWAAAACCAAAALLVLGLSGQREQSALQDFTPAGPMVGLAPEQVADVRILVGARQWHFVRERGRWNPADGSGGSTADTARLIDEGLRLLHNSAPQRVFAPDEQPDIAEAGLDPPRMRIVIDGPARFAIGFGHANPLGLARYARVEQQREVLLLPAFVAETWERVAGLR